jgi:hypothetical protein
MSLVVEDKDAAAAISGRNLGKTLNFNIDSGEFVFPKPKTGIISKLLPNEVTWHPLYDSSYSKIASNMYSIQGSELSESDKQAKLKEVEEVVVDSFTVKAFSTLYWVIIVFIIFLIIKLFVGESSGLTWILGIIFFIGIGVYAYASFVAKPAGETHWQNFKSDFGAKLNSGATPAKILEDYVSADNKKKEILMQRPSSDNVLLNSGTGSFFGSLLGNIISDNKKNK